MKRRGRVPIRGRIGPRCEGRVRSRIDLMTSRCWSVLRLALAPAAVAAQVKTKQFKATPRAAAQPNDPFFDDTVVHTIQLTVNSRDWQMLKDNKDDTYYPAD